MIKPHLVGKGFKYDINSMYPAMMKFNLFPVGKINKFIGNITQLNDYKDK
jgi:DNA polymerase family B